MKPKKFNNFKLKGDGELEFFDDDIVIDEWHNRLEIYLKLKSSKLKIRTIWGFDIKEDSSALKYLDEDLSVILPEKKMLSQAWNIIDRHTDIYSQMEDNFREDY